MKKLSLLYIPIFMLVGFFCFFSGADASASYLAEYWDTAAVEEPEMPVGEATVTTTVSEINFDWSSSSPAGIGADGFIARYTKTISGGQYVFRLGSDDGSRVYIDDTNILGDWVEQDYQTTSTVYTVPEGEHTLRVEYYENAGVAKVAFSYSVIFADGLGTIGSPYQISTCEQLQNIGSGGGIYLDKYFELTDDIDCTADTTVGGALYDNGYGFSPIGTPALPFRGNFDGSNFTITGLNINRNITDYVGLFGFVTSSISNVNLVDANVIGYQRVGGLVGRLSTGGTVNNSSITGTIEGLSYVGGLVGGSLGNIYNSRASTTVTGVIQYVGGLVGGTYGSITGSFSTGVVTVTSEGGDSGAGGLAGGASGVIDNCSSTASVHGTYAVGGLVGNATGQITNSYATGEVRGDWDYVGGLVGYLEGNVSTTYATGKVYGGSHTGGLVGVADAGGDIYDSYATGDVYNGHTADWIKSNGVSVGYDYSGERTGGLAGASSGIISNSFASGNVTSTDTNVGKVGGLIGGLEGEVINSSSTGNVYGAYMYVGGLIGYAINSSISESLASGNVSSDDDQVGGLIGYSYANTINNVYATGNVSGIDYVGGLIGLNTAVIPDSVNNCYSTGGVEGIDYVGGLIGFNDGDDVNNCFTVGTVTGLSDGFYLGLVGYDDTNTSSLYTNNYWYNNKDRGINSEFGFEDEIVGRWEKVASADIFQGDSMAEPFLTGTTQNWDTSIWAFPAGQYPQLQRVYGSWTPTCPTVANASTYNSYPTCGVATCASGYTLTNGACVVRSSGGGGAKITLPSGIGTGIKDAPASTLGTTFNVGSITHLGTNVLTYLNNLNNFLAPESSHGWALGNHSFQITNLDLTNFITTIIFNSEPITITLKKGESKDLDLDGDNINDIKATFANTYINRAEITITSLAIVVPVTEDSSTIITPVSKFIFKKNLSLGMRNTDVKELQKFLNSNGFIIAKSGIGSVGKESTYFGTATRNALIKFQKAKGIKPASGLFGPMTRGVVNK